MTGSGAIAIILAALCGGDKQAHDPTSLILSYKQYARIKHDLPYVLEFKVGKGAVI